MMASFVESLQAESSELEAAIRCGDISRAVEIAKRLAEKKTVLGVTDNPPSQQERPISVKIFIEDRHTSGIYITWKLLPSTTFYALKRKMYEKFEFPIEIQRWILRKRLMADDETLGQFHVTADEPVYLYLVPARSCGVTKESAQATYMGVKPLPPLTPRSLPQNTTLTPGGAQTQNDFVLPEADVVADYDDDDDRSNRHSDEDSSYAINDLNAPRSSEEAAATRVSIDVTEPKVGWVCAQCTYVNEPTRPGCAACTADRPADYLVPDDYMPSDAERQRLEREMELETQAAQELEMERLVNLEQILSINEQPLVLNTSVFRCPICFDEIPPNSGVILRDCLHTFCVDCLCGHVQASTSAIVPCPFNDGNYICRSQLQEREIKALVTPELYERLLALSMQEAESRESNSFHCVTADCTGWCIYEDDVNEFECPVCGHVNCLTCKALHEGKTCRQYQDELRSRAAVDVAAQRTQRKIEKMLKKGNAMNCPTCKIVVMKKDGCDWICCSMCKTEICWVTKGPRWGPLGEGDESGGCHCGKDDKLCHPNCQNCH